MVAHTVRTSLMGSGRGMNILLSEIGLWSASLLPQEGFMPGSFLQNVQSRAKCMKKCEVGLTTFIYTIPGLLEFVALHDVFL